VGGFRSRIGRHGGERLPGLPGAGIAQRPAVPPLAPGGFYALPAHGIKVREG